MENKAMAGFNFAKWRQVISAAVAFSLFTIPVISPSAHAASLIYQKLSGENFDPPTDIKFDHESRSMAARIFDDNKELITSILVIDLNLIKERSGFFDSNKSIKSAPLAGFTQIVLLELLDSLTSISIQSLNINGSCFVSEETCS